MTENILRPANQNFSEEAIWDAGVTLAYQDVELFDSIQVLQGVRKSNIDKQIDTPVMQKRIDALDDRLSELNGNRVMLAEAIGGLIGPEGIVLRSPNTDAQDEN